MIETIRQGLKAEGIEVSISNLCEWFAGPRRTVCYRQIDIEAVPRVDSRFLERIKAMIKEHLSFGYRTVAHLLDFNKNTVQRIFQLKGWQVKKRPVGFRPQVQALPSVAAAPNERWATDLCRVWAGRDLEFAGVTVDNQGKRRPLIGEWVRFYNHRRPHQAVGMKTPAATIALAPDPSRNSSVITYIHRKGFTVLRASMHSRRSDRRGTPTSLPLDDIRAPMRILYLLRVVCRAGVTYVCWSRRRQQSWRRTQPRRMGNALVRLYVEAALRRVIVANEPPLDTERKRTTATQQMQVACSPCPSKVRSLRLALMSATLIAMQSLTAHTATGMPIVQLVEPATTYQLLAGPAGTLGYYASAEIAWNAYVGWIEQENAKHYELQLAVGNFRICPAGWHGKNSWNGASTGYCSEYRRIESGVTTGEGTSSVVSRGYACPVDSQLRIKVIAKQTVRVQCELAIAKDPPPSTCASKPDCSAFDSRIAPARESCYRSLYLHWDSGKGKQIAVPYCFEFAKSDL